MASHKREIKQFMKEVERKNPHQPEFHQAVHEVVESLIPFVQENKKYLAPKILERLTEPDRVVSFRVCWEDDNGDVQINRAWRVQFNKAIGPYKGGLRFHPTVNESVLKFLGFEQTFKNSLTGLPMGGGKGGSNFDPRGKSDREVMRFCQSMMTELYRHIGASVDVPAGDIGVGARELGYLFGQYVRLSNEFTGTLTGKGLAYGGSLGRKEATGHGAVYFMENMLATQDEGLEGKTALVSGSGNVALYCIDKLIKSGATVLTASDSGGFIHDPDGIDAKKLAFLIDLKEVKRGRISAYADRYKKATFHAKKRPWAVKADLAFPCATQNELSERDAARMVKNGIMAVAEGANMPSTYDAVHTFLKAKVLFAPGKAANAGGVAVSGLEQSQNALRMSWSREEVDEKLATIMRNIHDQCARYGTSRGFTNYVKGSNIGGFVKVADAMLAYGVG